jgi:hypothetical protein
LLRDTIALSVVSFRFLHSPSFIASVSGVPTVYVIESHTPDDASVRYLNSACVVRLVSVFVSCQNELTSALVLIDIAH